MLEMIILLFLIFLNGLFVMAEIALVSARKSRLENLADNGDEKARSALQLSENPELFLSTAQIGITLIAILVGFQTRIVSYILALFCVATAFVAHFDFADQMQAINFQKNLAMAGGFLVLAAYGAGALSVDARRA